MAKDPQKRLTLTECKWRTLIAEWRDSGLTAREFCEKKGLKSHKTLHVWSSKLNKIDANADENDEYASFVPVRVIDDEKAVEVEVQSQTIDVYLACGDVICAPRGCDMQQFSQVVAILRKEWQ